MRQILRVCCCLVLVAFVAPLWVAAPAAADPPKSNTIDLEQGRRHWAFQSLNRTEPPAAPAHAAWARTPIDRFILAKLEPKGLKPNPVADRRTLIRRAYFDLIGLPPQPAEVASFVSDPDPDAYAKLIDRLLQNPHFGERWARHWLDVARFAESHGYEQDYDRPNAYHYRDFAIRAFNQDLPYDTFVKWQIAGDEFEPDNPLALMATGFLAAGTHATQITANQAEKERYDELDDMARTIGTTLLGLTIGCARCHDHKFDPVPTSDYYRLISTFSTTVRSDFDVNLEPAAFKQAKAKFDAEHSPLADAIQKFEKHQLPARFDAWRRQQAATDLPRWLLADPVEPKSAGGATFTKLDDGSLLVGGTNPDNDTYTFVVHTQSKGITALRLEALAHESLVKGGPGRAPNGNFGLTDFHVTAEPLAGGQPAMPVKLVNPRATFDQAGLPVSNAIDDKKDSCWAVDPQFGKDHAAVFELESPVGFDGGTKLTFVLEFKCNKQHGMGRPRLSLTTVPGPAPLDGQPAPEAAVRVLARLSADRGAVLTDEERSAVLRWYRTLDPEWRKLNAQVQEHAKQSPQPKLAKMLISSEGVPAVRLHTQGLDFYDPVHVLKRGDLNQKTELATQSFLRVLMRAPDGEKHWQESPPAGCRTSYRRRALANWLTDVDLGAGHLLARVIVNRLWYLHMGRGIVATPSDFGRQGSPPTHPELLDWLASKLISPSPIRVVGRGEGSSATPRPWSLKHIHKLIMTSAVYMQTADADERRLMADRDNSLFWRRPGRRLEAEIIRDAMLAVGGQLDETPFGPGTLEPNHRRRSIYFFVKRSKLIPMMTLFDAPDSLQDLPNRACTTIAPQALMLMNSSTVRDHATALARRLSPADPSNPSALADAVRTGYSLALSRPPSDAELADSIEFLTQQTASYRAAGKPDAADLALADFCQTLMSLNEFVYVE